jgi:hypothetical protein
MVGEADRTRELLFGVPAFRTGLIDRTELFAALDKWKDASQCPVAKCLTGQGALEADRRAVIDSLVALDLKAHGDAAKSLLAATVAATLEVGDQLRASAAAIGGAGLGATISGCRLETADDKNAGRRTGRCSFLRPNRCAGP